MARGTINVERSIWSDPAFKDQPMTEREAYIWLVMEASYRPREMRVGHNAQQLKRGQLAHALRFMAEAWKWPKSTVDRFLKRLEKRDMIHIESGTGVSIITICNYDETQGTPSDLGTEMGQTRDSNGTDAGQTRDKLESSRNLVGTNEKPSDLFGDSEGKKQRSAKKASSAGILQILTEILDDETAQAFIDHRKQLKPALTAQAAKLTLDTLRKCQDPKACTILSIERGWKGIYPEDDSQQQNGGKRKLDPTIAYLRAQDQQRNDVPQRGQQASQRDGDGQRRPYGDQGEDQQKQRSVNFPLPGSDMRRA